MENEVKLTQEAKIFSLKAKDFIKGFIITILMAIVVGIYQLIQNNQFPKTLEEWKTILITAIGAGCVYIIKNFLTSSDDKFLTKEK